jgi:hypothetical protein
MIDSEGGVDLIVVYRNKDKSVKTSSSRERLKTTYLCTQLVVNR